jgi:hypothetical protein
VSKKERIEFLEEAVIRLTEKVDEVTHAYNLLAKAFDVLNGEIKEYIKSQGDIISDDERDGAIDELRDNEYIYRFILGCDAYDAMIELLTKDKSV